MDSQHETASSKASISGGLFGRLKCLLGAHDWETVSIGFDFVSHLKECRRCGRGAFLQFLGHASMTGKVSREEMQQWHREARGPNSQLTSPGTHTLE